MLEGSWGGVSMCRGGGVSGVKKFNVGSVTVRMGRRVGGAEKFWGTDSVTRGLDQDTEREREGDLTGERGRSRQSESRQKGLTNSEG